MTVRTAAEGARELPGLSPTPGRAFGIYVHVPFCAARCGYCDFNTYTPAELGGANPVGWLAGVRSELALAADRLRSAPAVNTVFVGGGTPSLLGGSGLAAVLDAVREHFTLAPEAEVTTEANPESTSPQLLEQLRTAGFEHVNLDLIYGTPGETDDDLLRSVDAAVEARVDHVSAYALVVEDGTALARRVRRGEVSAPDNDELAHRYELIDARLSAAGFGWYEVSNWCLPGGECLHNVGYWNGGEWWGAGPGAHGFIGTTRWWNVKHPNAYAEALAEGQLPVADFERLDPGALHTEDVMLRVRLRDGLPMDTLNEAERRRAQTVIEDGLLARDGDRLILTDPGRLLADAV